jgi:hypothetical protein
MAKQTARYITLESVVYDFINEANLTDAAFFRLWNIAIRGLEAIGMDISNEPKTRKLKVLPNKTVELPGDYLEWVKVGVLNANGEVATLKRNSNLTKYAAIDNDRLSVNVNASIESHERDFLFRNYYWEDQYVNLLGVSSGTEEFGQFDVDSVNGVILLNNNYAYDYVILEYLCSPTANGDYLVEVQLREAIISWLRWKDIQSMPAGRRKNLGEVQMRMKDFYNERRLARMRLNPLRIFEANDVIRLGYKLAVKA